MKHLPRFRPLICATAILLTGCATSMQNGTTHLSPAQCRDLTALKNNAPITSERNRSELAALETAGYHPSMFFDPYYPDDLQAAQRQVDRWYQVECQSMPPS
ncbi:DUF4148 domain-containing protein [Caballeronia sp. LP006]|jgi:hypothetical protein|uniref:DUF4148 domain-containing protein n=1 Tax=unclassified Caballeronia TaxID=2646786 RepID=UPI0020278AAA|nr:MULTISPECIES: DUF4148 domain-containing protein [unclassified Caballeronia]MDR5827455.1 DUF4148 domain-containing protein [Caballeronia sp. LP006]